MRKYTVRSPPCTLLYSTTPYVTVLCHTTLQPYYGIHRTLPDTLWYTPNVARYYTILHMHMHMCNQRSPNTAKADQVIRTENGLSLLTYPGSLLTLYTSLTTFKFPKPTPGTSKLWGVGAFHYAKAMSWQRQKECFLLAYNSTCIERGGLRATNQQQTPGAAVWFRRSSLSTRRSIYRAL